jgi:sugar lactone lactonase YvrE
MSDTAYVGADVTTGRAVRSRRGRRILALVLVVLILLLGLVTYLLFNLISVPRTSNVAVETGGITWVRSIYGMSDAEDDQLARAQSAATAPDGSIWVTDGQHQALIHFTADGRYLGSLSGPDDLPLFSPSRIAIDTDGTIYACELTEGAIRVLNTDNTDAGSFGIPEPTSVAVSSDRIVVGTVAGFAILDKEGTPIKVLGSRGKSDDQFDYVHGVAIADNGNIFVSDSYNNRLSAYDPEGNRLWIVRTGKPANGAEMTDGSLVTKDATDAVLSGDDALQLPLGITLDGAGRIVVADMFDCTLAVFDPTDGSFIAKYGEVGPDDGQFFYPVSVTYDGERDWFTVADSLNNRIQIVRLPGSSAGSGVASAVRRAMTGPLRACVYPFLLLLLAIIAWLVVRRARKRRELVEPVRAAVQPEVVDE